MVTGDRLETHNDDDRVVPLRPRGIGARRSGMLSNRQQNDTGVGDLAEFEQDEPEDDYRHRIMVNVLGLLAAILLVVAGVWLAVKIADNSKIQDCVLSGRKNCAPIGAPPIQRY
jgi:hypothetical protein